MLVLPVMVTVLTSFRTRTSTRLCLQRGILPFCCVNCIFSWNGKNRCQLRGLSLAARSHSCVSIKEVLFLVGLTGRMDIRTTRRHAKAMWFLCCLPVLPRVERMLREKAIAWAPFSSLTVGWQLSWRVLICVCLGNRERRNFKNANANSEKKERDLRQLSRYDV